MWKVKYKCCKWFRTKYFPANLFYERRDGRFRFLPSEAQLNSASLRDLRNPFSNDSSPGAIRFQRHGKPTDVARGFNVSRVIHVAKWAWTVLTLRTRVRRSGTFLRRTKGAVGLDSELQRELSDFSRRLSVPLNPAPDALASSVIEFLVPTIFPRPANLFLI